MLFAACRWPGRGPSPRSWAAQERAVDAAVAQALEQERARVVRRAARRKAERAAKAAGGAPPAPPVPVRPRPAQRAFLSQRGGKITVSCFEAGSERCTFQNYRPHDVNRESIKKCGAVGLSGHR